MSEKRLTKPEAKIVRDGLILALEDERQHHDIFVHPDWLPNRFGDIYINDAQKRGYLARLAQEGRIQQHYTAKGWYKYCTYRAYPPEQS